MRRGTILLLGLFLAATLMPQEADARPRLLKMLRASPFGLLLGAGPHMSRSTAYHRRAAAAKSTRAARAKATAAAAATAGTTAAVAGTSSSDNPAASTGQPADSDTANANAQAATTGSAASDEPRDRPNEALRARPPQHSRLGTVGPLTWPSAYEDVVGFALWPKEYGERLKAHGISDILGTALLPNATLAARMRATSVQARADEPTAAPVATGCGSVDLTANDWPIAQITGAIDLDDSQRATLDRLKIALSDAIASIKSTCRGDEASLTPVERLRALQNTLWAVHDAAQLVRGPLAKFYDSLTDEQKRQFAAPSQEASPRMSRAEMARMCGSPASADAPTRQLEQSLRPTKVQRASLEALQKKSFEMGQFLMASCLSPVPATPAERLDAAAERLAALIFAASNVNIALNDFTRDLTDEQKSRLNALR